MSSNQEQHQAPVSPEEVFIEIKEPTLPKRIIKKTLYYTVGAVVEPQEPRYSAICFLLSICGAFAGGMLIKKCV
jgi:hypothetical protein